MKYTILFSLLLVRTLTLSAQETFTRKDSLHGGLRFERTCFDVLHYDLNIKINPDNQSIMGYNDITFKTVENTSKIQLDLFENMQIDSIVFNAKKLSYKREFEAVFVNFETAILKNSEQKIRFYYSGKPLAAKHAPWDGGFVWFKDSNGKDWVGVATQEPGSSLLYPVKDSKSDEPDFG